MAKRAKIGQCATCGLAHAPGACPDRSLDEHPEDRRLRKASEAYARAHIHEFFEEHRDAFIDLVGMYADAMARDSLEVLREKFWGGDWKPKKKG